MFDIRNIQEQIIYHAVKAESNDETANAIVISREEDNCTWVKNTMKRLENHFDKAITRKIRMNCQCGYGLEEKLSLLKELLRVSAGLEEFASHDSAKAAGISFCNGNLFLQFLSCPCPMLDEVSNLETDTWCQCTTGYSKVVFEKAFGCEVDVELLKSIKMGNEICLMKIIPLGAIQFR